MQVLHWFLVHKSPHLRPQTPKLNCTMFLALVWTYWLSGLFVYAAKPLEDWWRFLSFQQDFALRTRSTWLVSVLKLYHFFFSFFFFFFLTKRKPICNLVLQISVRIEVWSWKNQCNQHYLPVLFQEQENLLSNHWGGINATWYFVMYCNY